MQGPATLNDVFDIKKEGNRKFTDGEFIGSCLSYAKAIETMIEIESSDSPTEGDARKFDSLKSLIFLNLCIANFKLNEIEG